MDYLNYNTKAKLETPEEFYKNTFDQIYSIYKDKISIIGKTMFIHFSSFYITLEFVGSTKATTSLLICAFNKIGMFGRLDAPFEYITGKNSYVMDDELESLDKKKINNATIKYIEIIKGLK